MPEINLLSRYPHSFACRLGLSTRKANGRNMACVIVLCQSLLGLSTVSGSGSLSARWGTPKRSRLKTMRSEGLRLNLETRASRKWGCWDITRAESPVVRTVARKSPSCVAPSARSLVSLVCVTFVNSSFVKIFSIQVIAARLVNRRIGRCVHFILVDSDFRLSGFSITKPFQRNICAFCGDGLVIKYINSSLVCLRV